MDSIAIHMCLIFIFKFVQIMTKLCMIMRCQKEEEEEEEGMLICQRTTKSKIS